MTQANPSPTQQPANAPVRMGMVGGGEGAFIGPVHRMAAELDGQVRLVCGAFASDPQRSLRSGQQLYGLPAQRCYATYAELFTAERQRAAGERMQFVSVVTPNHLHFPVAQAALLAGFPVVCDKPLSISVEQARILVRLCEQQQLPFMVTYNYTGYPMVREARARLAAAELGPIRRVIVEYLQGWLAQDVQNKQALWRTDPALAGPAGCLGDIGSHAQNLAEFMLGEQATELAAELNRFVPGRALDDDVQVRLRFASGARGTLLASQIAYGEENNLRIRIYGERGALRWSQQEPNSLLLQRADRPWAELRTGGPGVGEQAQAVTRLPAGHPEGYLESFATLYREFASGLRQPELSGPLADSLPSVHAGLQGMLFTAAVLRSAELGGQWERVE